MQYVCNLSYFTTWALTITLTTAALSDDTFVCHKADIRSEGACLSDKGTLKRIEERLADVEKRLEEHSLVARELPSVIRLQQISQPRDCLDIFRSGDATDGVYRVSPNGYCKFDVYCDMTNGGWTVIQRRVGGSVNFRRTWNEYVKGFGDITGEFWLGLEKIHQLTKGGSQIYFTLSHYNTNLEPEWAHYQDFVVYGVSSAYTMNVGNDGYKGSLPDLLSYHNGKKFSTYDRDHDYFSHSCSETNGGGGGWWYFNCYRLGILNGVYGKKGPGGISYWDRGVKYVKDVEIKVKAPYGSCTGN